MKSFLITFPITLLFIYGSNISVSAQSRYETELDVASAGNKPIPENFNPANGILLIVDKIDQDSSKVYNSVSMSYRSDDYMNNFIVRHKDKMVDYLEKNYPNKYEFATQSEIYNTDSKYNDKTVYRYALVISMVKRKQQYETQHYSGQNESTHHQPIFRYYIYDRQANKTYAALGKGASTIMLPFKAAIKKIKENK